MIDPQSQQQCSAIISSFPPSNSQKSAVYTRMLQALTSSDILTISFDQKNVFEEVMSEINESTIMELNANSFGVPHIFHLLSKVCFSRLIDLRLSHNNIVSVQVIINLKMPDLQRIFLNYNLLTSIKSFRKVKFPVLKTISFSENLLQQAKGLSECQLQQMDYLIVYMSSAKINQTIQTFTPLDHRYLFKLQAKDDVKRKTLVYGMNKNKNWKNLSKKYLHLTLSISR